MYQEEAFIFMQKMSFFVKIENLGTYFSIFHDFSNWASFSLHIWMIKWMLQPLTTYGIITIIKIKTPLCG